MSPLPVNTWRDIYDFRFALQNLVLKDFRIRYRNMALGLLWSLLNPLVMLGVLVFIFAYVFPNQNVEHFPVFVLLGLVTFNAFSLTLSFTTNCVVENASLVKKIIFPRILLPLSVILSQFIQIFIQWILVALFIVILRVPITLHYLWLVPIFFVQIAYMTGFSLICCTLNVYFRDVLYVVQSALTLLFWFTPVFYSLTMVHENLPRALYALYILNPMAGCVDGARKAVLNQCAPDTIAFSFSIGVALLSLLAGYGLFQRYSRNFTDRL